MTEFFKSEQVKTSLRELAELQDELAHTMTSAKSLDVEERKDYVP